MEASRSVLLSSVLAEQEVARLEQPEFSDPENLKTSGWMCFYSGMMPLTDWLIRGIAPLIRAELFHAAIPNMYELPVALTPSQYDKGVYYKRGIGPSTPVGMQFPAFHVSDNVHQDLEKKSSQHLSTYLRSNKGGFSAPAAVGIPDFTANLTRALAPSVSHTRGIDETFQVTRCFGLPVQNICRFRKPEARNAVINLLGKEFFSVTTPYHKTFKLKEKFSTYLGRVIAETPLDLVTALLSELNVSDWILSYTVEGYDDDPENFKMEDLASAYLEWLDESITEFDLISTPVVHGYMNNLVDGEGKAVLVTSLADPQLATAKIPSSVYAEDYPAYDFYVDSVLSGRSVTMQVMMGIPKDVAAFATQSRDGDIDEYSLLQILNKSQLELANFEYGKVNLAEHTDATHGNAPLSETISILKSRKPSKRIGVNAKGLGVTSEGTLIYIPTSLDKFSQNRKEITEYFDSQQFKKGERIIALRDPFDIAGNRRVFGKEMSERPRPEPTAVQAKMSYVDWGLGMLIGIDSTGSEVNLLDIRHVTPLTDSSLSNYANAALYPVISKGSNILSNSITEILSRTKPNQYNAITEPLKALIGNYATKAITDVDLLNYIIAQLRDIFTGININGSVYNLIEEDRIDYTAATISSAIKMSDFISTLHDYCYTPYMVGINRATALLGDELPVELDHMLAISTHGFGQYFTLAHLANNYSKSPSLLTRIYGFIISRIWETLKGKEEILMRNNSVSYGLYFYGTLAAVADLLENPRPLSRKAYDTSEQVPNDYIPEALPGSKEGYSMLPHQLRVDLHMSNMAINEDIKFRILYAMAGAGKTHNLLNDVMRLLEAGKVDKPLIVCPNYLIKNYIEDAAYIYEGRLNVIPLDTEIKNYSPLMGVSTNLGLEGMLTMIENAPRNTVFVTSYTFLSSGNNSALELPVGMSTAYINPHIEMMLEAGFDYVGADESHELRNEGTIKWDSCLTLFYRANHRVIATGTFLNTSPSDVPAQTVMLDPTVFGSHTDFFDYYADVENRGARISKLLDSRKDELVQSLRTAVGYIQVKRKEWSALLPARKDSYHIMKLDPESIQWRVYQAIMGQVILDIQKILDQNKAVANEANEGDEGAEENLENLLRPYLQRLEMLLITPYLDEDFERIVQELDGDIDPDAPFISPGVERCIEIIRAHLGGVNLNDGHNGMDREERFYDVRDYMGLSQEAFNNGEIPDVIPRVPGKILVFCNYKTSVKAVYDALPPDLQKRAIAYDASNKDKHIFEFKNNPEKDILIGIHTSLATGHNFQFCTRLIRLEQVWAPGEVEQGESRINRPDPKNKGAKRNQIFYDWIVVDGTIQITKLARLISRMVVNTEVEEHGNPAYNDVPYLPLLKMNLTTIQNNCWFRAPSDEQAGVNTERSLITYLETKHQIDTIQNREFKEWRENYEGAVDPVEVPVGPVLPNSKLVSNIPPIPGQVIANADKFDLVNVAKYETEVGIQGVDLRGMRCYTPEGDGEIVAMKGTKLHVQIGKTKYSFDRLAVNIYKNPKYDRNDLIAATGLKDVVTIQGSQNGKVSKKKAMPEPVLDYGDEEDVQPTKKVKVVLDDSVDTKKASKVSLDNKTKVVKVIKTTPMPEPTDSDEGEADGEIEVIATNTNGALCLMLSSEDADLSDRKATRLMKSLGFHLEPDCWYAEIPTRKALEDVLAKFEAKFDIPEKVLDKWYDLVDTFSVGRRKLFNADQASALEIKEYWLMDYKRILRKDPDVLVPVPLVQDGELYMLLDMQLPSSKRAKRLRVPNISWEASGGLWMKLYSTKSECAADLRELQSRYEILDKELLKKDIKAITITNKKVNK